jgi:hypothetical protein
MQGIGDFRAHDDECRDHQKKAETHERLEPNACFGSRIAAQGREPISIRLRMTVPVHSGVVAAVNRFQPFR